MPKSSHHQNRDRDMKKKPLMTPKEKKAAKQAKKHIHDVQPFIPPDATTTH
jgi:hypothetical protein